MSYIVQRTGRKAQDQSGGRREQYTMACFIHTSSPTPSDRSISLSSHPSSMRIVHVSGEGVGACIRLLADGALVKPVAVDRIAVAFEITSPGERLVADVTSVDWSRLR